MKNIIDRTAHLFLWRLSQVNADPESWRWLRNGILKKGTEMIICAAQGQALRMNSIKDFIDRTDNSLLCRLRRKATESVHHILSGCTQMAQKEYR